MKKNILITLMALAAGVSQAQLIPSSCSAADSIVKKYQDDADRLALRYTFKQNGNFKDSVKIDKPASDRYLRSLIAVYNATAIPARDTVVTMLNIHTKALPEMRKFHVKAPGNLAWMDSLRNSKYPTGQLNIDFLMNKYQLQNYGYYQSTNYDLVIFRADSNLNLNRLCQEFAGIQNVISADPEESYNEVKEIRDSVNLLYQELNYTYGWGSCNDGCDYTLSWRFRVYNDCSVEYLGQTGSALYTGLPEYAGETLQVFPVPAENQVNIVTLVEKTIEIIDLSGRVLLTEQLRHGSNTLDISSLPAGVYLLRDKNSPSSGAVRLVRH